MEVTQLKVIGGKIPIYIFQDANIDIALYTVAGTQSKGSDLVPPTSVLMCSILILPADCYYTGTSLNMSSNGLLMLNISAQSTSRYRQYCNAISLNVEFQILFLQETRRLLQLTTNFTILHW